MRINHLVAFLALTVSEMSLAQAVEWICVPAPTEVERTTCFILATENHLAIRVENEKETAQVLESIHDAMENHGFVELSENIYWYPSYRTCYFSLYGIGTESMVLVPSERLGSGGPPYCDSRGNYNAASFGTVIERELEKNELLDIVSIYFTNIDLDSELYEKILESGGTPGLMRENTGELATINIQY